jgi:hypothetical protein
MKENKLSKFMSLIALFICFVLVSAISFAGNGDLVKIEFNGQTTSVDQNNRSMVVNRMNVRGVSNMILKSGESLNTVFIDENGKTIPFSEFKKDSWVKVTGYKTNDGTVFASIIQRQYNQSVKNAIPLKTVNRNYSV